MVAQFCGKKVIHVHAFLFFCSRYTGRESPCILFSVPDGHTKPSPTGGAKTKVSRVLCDFIFIQVRPVMEQVQEDSLEVYTGGFVAGIIDLTP